MNRLPVQGRPSDYRTFQVRSPLSTHFRAATCEEVACEHWRNGWTTRLDKATQAALIRTVQESGRTPSAVLEDAETVTFVFEPGTRCFRSSEHAMRVERPEIYVVKDGDWRASSNTRRYDRPDQWVDDFAAHQDRLATLINRG